MRIEGIEAVHGESGGGASPRLMRAAREFEGQMMKELLKPLQDSTGFGDDEQRSGVLGEFATEALGQALSKGGGLGIADTIVSELSRRGNEAP